MKNNFLLNNEKKQDINIEDYNNFIQTNFNMKFDIGVILSSLVFFIIILFSFFNNLTKFNKYLLKISSIALLCLAFSKIYNYTLLLKKNEKLYDAFANTNVFIYYIFMGSILILILLMLWFTFF